MKQNPSRLAGGEATRPTKDRTKSCTPSCKIPVLRIHILNTCSNTGSNTYTEYTLEYIHRIPTRIHLLDTHSNMQMHNTSIDRSKSYLHYPHYLDLIRYNTSKPAVPALPSPELLIRCHQTFDHIHSSRERLTSVGTQGERFTTIHRPLVHFIIGIITPRPA